MATKTERIMSYLPATFKAAQTHSPLKAVMDTFGNELQNAENSLAAVMRAHWVDHADNGMNKIDDLIQLAALYGLAPRVDESVEEFRQHLKQYVKTLLQGTVTVQGLLRIAANNLGLSIADDYADMDTWWTNEQHDLTLLRHCGNDVASKLFGENQLESIGDSAKSAQIIGHIKIDSPIDLTNNGKFTSRTLRIKLNGQTLVTVDLIAAINNPLAATITDLTDAINITFGSEIASSKNNYLTITALTNDSTSKVAILEHPNDAAPILFGLLPHTYKGLAVSKATITGTTDLSGNNDLTSARYLRMRLDGTQLAEIDCAGTDVAATTLDEIKDAINAVFSASIATHDGVFLTLQSSSSGDGSSIAFLNAASQDATSKLFGSPATILLGHDKLPAKIISIHDHKNGVDLSKEYNLRIRVNTSTAINIDCRGLEPANSQLPEIVNVINDTLGKNVASHNGRNLILTSTTQGVASKLSIEHVDENDASERLLGIRSRSANGASATSARITSEIDLSTGINLFASNTLRIQSDHRQAFDINISSHAASKKEVSLNEIVQSINSALTDAIASHDGQFLSLISNKIGSASGLKIKKLETTYKRRFVSRVTIVDEASDKIFGFNNVKVTGQDPTPAQVVGLNDLSRGVDLRSAQYLTIQINQQAPITVSCAGPRSRATLLKEVTDNINDAFAKKIAFDDNGFLKLIATSDSDPNEEFNPSVIEFLAPRVTDAVDVLLSTPLGILRGSDATGVSFVGTNNLSSGVDLSINHTLKLKIDNDDPIEINCSGLVANQTTLAQIAIAINIAFAKNYATHDGSHILLTSLLSGSDSLLEIMTPVANDATSLILGVTSPRVYHGNNASSAFVNGQVDLSGNTINLSERSFLQLGIDSAETQTVDCASEATDQENVTLTEIIEAINLAMNADIASDSGGVINLTSPSKGLSSRINLQAHTGSDARHLLFGEVGSRYEGTAATSAVLKGQIDLRQGVDLSERNQLKIAFDGQQPIDIKVFGETPNLTFAEEIADAINQSAAQSASVTDAGILELRSSRYGSQSSIEVLPIRFLELQEYLPNAPVKQQKFEVQHGTAITVRNTGVTSVESEILIHAPKGVYGAGLVNHDTNWQVRILSTIHSGEVICIKQHPRLGLAATVCYSDSDDLHVIRTIPATDILVGPLLPQMHVPSNDIWHLARGLEMVDALILNNPLAPNIIELRSQLDPYTNLSTSKTRINTRITLEVKQSDLSKTLIPEKQKREGSQNSYQFIGRIILINNEFMLQDKNNQDLVQLLSSDNTELSNYVDFAIVVIGELVSDLSSLHDELLVESIARLFDVRLDQQNTDSSTTEEFYGAVTIGEKGGIPLALDQRFIFDSAPSKLVRATPYKKNSILNLSKGRSHWRFIECDSSRFNVSHFSDQFNYSSRFAGGLSTEQGLLNISSTNYQPPERIVSVFAESNKKYIHTSQVEFKFLQHQPGTLRINLPADLEPRFGGRFDDAIFGLPTDKPEKFEQIVTEPDSDPNYLVTQINDHSILIEAKHVDTVPIGYSAVAIPFSKPKAFILGSRSQAARIYLSELEVSGFIELAARKTGEWGNQLSVIVCDSGPAIFDLLVSFPGSRFESARQIVEGEPLTSVVTESLKPTSIGIKQAKAVGIHIEVTRENCEISKTIHT